MATKRTGADTPKTRPARTPDERERQLINLAMDETERLIKAQRAPATLLVHFLKLGTAQAELELENARADNALKMARVASMESQARAEERYAKALEAMTKYSGQYVEHEYED